MTSNPPPLVEDHTHTTNSDSGNSGSPLLLAETGRGASSLWAWDIGPLQYQHDVIQHEASTTYGEGSDVSHWLSTLPSSHHDGMMRLSVSFGFRPEDGAAEASRSKDDVSSSRRGDDDISSVEGDETAQEEDDTAVEASSTSPSPEATSSTTAEGDTMSRMSTFYVRVLQQYRDAVEAGTVRLQQNPFDRSDSSYAVQLEGDPTMHTDENIRKRMAIQHNPDIVALIQRTWDLLPKRGEVQVKRNATPISPSRRNDTQSPTPIVVAAGSVPTATLREASPKKSPSPSQATLEQALTKAQSIPKLEYINLNVFRAISAYVFRRLVPDGDVEAFLRHCDEDWRIFAAPPQGDSRRSSSAKPHMWLMNKSQFVKTMFTIVDVWTTTAEVNEYHHFLERVVIPQAQKITDIDPNVFFDVRKNVFAKGAFRKRRGKKRSSSSAQPSHIAEMPLPAAQPSPLDVLALTPDAVKPSETAKRVSTIAPLQRKVNAKKLWKSVVPQRLNVFCIESDDKMMRNGPVVGPSAHTVRHRILNLLKPATDEVQLHLTQFEKAGRLAGTNFRLYAIGDRKNGQVFEFLESEMTGEVAPNHAGVALNTTTGDGNLLAKLNDQQTSAANVNSVVSSSKRPLPLLDVKIASQGVQATGCRLYSDASKQSSAESDDDEPQRVVKPEELALRLSMPPPQAKEPKKPSSMSHPLTLTSLCLVDDGLLPNSVCFAPELLTFHTSSVSEGISEQTIVAPYSRLDDALEIVRQQSSAAFRGAIDEATEYFDGDGNLVDPNAKSPAPVSLDAEAWSPEHDAEEADPKATHFIEAEAGEAVAPPPIQIQVGDDFLGYARNTGARNVARTLMQFPLSGLVDDDALKSYQHRIVKGRKFQTNANSSDWNRGRQLLLTPASFIPTPTPRPPPAPSAQPSPPPPPPPPPEAPATDSKDVIAPTLPTRSPNRNQMKKASTNSGETIESRDVYGRPTHFAATARLPRFPVDPAIAPSLERRRHFRQECGEIISDEVVKSAYKQRLSRENEQRERIARTATASSSCPTATELWPGNTADDDDTSSMPLVGSHRNASPPVGSTCDRKFQGSTISSGVEHVYAPRGGRNPRLGEADSVRGSLPAQALKQVKAVVPRIVPSTKAGKVVIVEATPPVTPLKAPGRGSIPPPPRGASKHHVTLKVFESYDRPYVDHLLAGPRLGAEVPSMLRELAAIQKPNPGEVLESIVLHEAHRYPKSLSSLSAAVVEAKKLSDHDTEACSDSKLLQALPSHIHELVSATVSNPKQAVMTAVRSVSSLLHPLGAVAVAEAVAKAALHDAGACQLKPTAATLQGLDRSPRTRSLMVEPSSTRSNSTTTQNMDFGRQLKVLSVVTDNRGHMSSIPGRHVAAVAEHVAASMQSQFSAEQQLDSKWTAGIDSSSPDRNSSPRKCTFSVLDRPDDYFGQRSMTKVEGRDLTAHQLFRQREAALLHNTFNPPQPRGEENRRQYMEDMTTPHQAAVHPLAPLPVDLKPSRLTAKAL